MKPITAEDKTVRAMEGRQAKLFGVLVLVVAFVVFAINSLRATQFSIQDNNPASYVIVVMLMLPLAIIFALKEDLHFGFTAKGTAIGVSAFLVYVVAVSYLRASLSFVFQAYRIDALLFPLILVSLISLLFGTDGLSKMKFPIIYSIFASPILLIPVMLLNGGFASANAYLIFNVLKALGIPVVKSGLTISAGSASSISIATTCADIGAFIALFMFLVPVAYVLNGRPRNKALWLVSGIVLMLALNIGRMLAISLQWAYYGISVAVATLHTFAGQVLFDIAIIVMILIAGRYSLSVPKINAKRNSAAKRTRHAKSKTMLDYAVPVACALVIALVGFFVTVPYTTSVYANPLNFTGRAPSNSLIQQSLAAHLSNAHSSIEAIGSVSGSMLFMLQNSSYGTVYILAGMVPKPTNANIRLNSSTIRSRSVLLLDNGIALTRIELEANSTTIYINYFSMPVLVGGNYTTAYYEFVSNSSESTACVPHVSLQNSFQSSIYNLLQGNSDSGKLICAAYDVAMS